MAGVTAVRHLGIRAERGAVPVRDATTTPAIAQQYAATKAALPALARSWAAEPADRAITVNVSASGPTDTHMAGLAAFLLGPEGGGITGHQLVQCAGASL